MLMVHAENHEVIKWLGERLLAAGKSQPKYHAVAHAAPAEREATHRAIALSEIVGLPVLIVHVSEAGAIEQIREAQARGLPVFAETCPQYLFLSEDELDRPGFEGAKFICSPPLRRKGNEAHVWRGLETGVFQVFSSDHAPYRFDDAAGKRKHGANAPFPKVPNGMPGLEVRMPLLFSEGVRTGRIGLERFVALTATEPARIYGLYPRKGTIAVGADADIAIWDPEREVTITRAMLHDNMDYTPYEGRTVTGWPITALSRGEAIWDKGEVLGRPGRGRFLRCARPEPAQVRPGAGFAPAEG
jgi:dihydropyrimidinase